MIFEKYTLGEPKNAAYYAVADMMKDRDLGVSYADMIRYRLGGEALLECRDTYYVAHKDGVAAALLYCPERAGILFSEDGHAVGWSFDGEIQVHPMYSGAKIEKI